MTLSQLVALLSNALRDDPTMGAILPTPGFFLGAAPVGHDGKAIVPCVTLNGLVCTDDKLGWWTADINLVSEDRSLEFLELAQHFLRLLDRTGVIETSGFLHRPEPQNDLNRARYPVRFQIDSRA